MPEGHTLFRLARTLHDHFADRVVAVTSPQGRFEESAALLDGTRLETAQSYGKHLFVDFDHERCVHVHLGLYGKFAVHHGEAPEPRGQVRLRLVAPAVGERPAAYGDLRGATACELITTEQQQRIFDRLGPDPLRADADWTRAWDRVSRSRGPIGGLLMDQSVLAGIGNVYRAEVLFRHRVDPLRPGSSLRRSTFEQIWNDLVVLLDDGVRAALAWSEETAELGRLHNDANVVSVGGRMHTLEDMTRFVEVFLTTPFSEEERHARRIEMLASYEDTGELPPLPASAAGSGAGRDA